MQSAGARSDPPWVLLTIQGMVRCIVHMTGDVPHAWPLLNPVWVQHDW